MLSPIGHGHGNARGAAFVHAHPLQLSSCSNIGLMVAWFRPITAIDHWSSPAQAR